MENLPGSEWGDGQRQALGKGLLCFLLLSLFPPFHFPLCCDLSSGIQVNKCHIFQPIFTLGNAPSPSPLSCCSCFCYHCNCSPPTLPEIPSLTPSQSLNQHGVLSAYHMPGSLPGAAEGGVGGAKKGSPSPQALSSSSLQSWGGSRTGTLKSLTNHERVNQPCKPSGVVRCPD